MSLQVVFNNQLFVYGSRSIFFNFLFGSFCTFKLLLQNLKRKLKYRKV